MATKMAMYGKQEMAHKERMARAQAVLRAFSSSSFSRRPKTFLTYAPTCGGADARAFSSGSGMAGMVFQKMVSL